MGSHPSPVDGQRSDGAPLFGPPRVEEGRSSSGTIVGGTPAGLGSSRPVDALSLEEEERQLRELQRAFGGTLEDVARAQWQRSTRVHWSLDPPSVARGAAPSLHGVGGVAANGLARSAADTGRLRHLAQDFRDAGEEASTAASDGSPIPGRAAAVASALAAAQGPFPRSESAGETVAREHGSETLGGTAPREGRAVTGSSLTVGATRAARPTRSRSRQAARRRLQRQGPRRDHRRRRRSRRDKSPPSSGPSSSTQSERSPTGSSSDPSGTDVTDHSRGSTPFASTGSDHGATSRPRRAREAEKFPPRALVQEALRAFRREQQENTVVEPRFKGLLSPERYRLAQRRGRLHLPRVSSIPHIRADVKALIHTSRQLASDSPLGVVAFLGNVQTACDGSGLNEGTAVNLMQYFFTSEVPGVLQRAKDTQVAR